jgi:pimeloyl-ACP methyl ester carboxylesterase
MAFSVQNIALSGAKVSMKRGGSGEPLLFLHGAEGLTEWPAILDRLAMRYDVLVPDLPGFGLSPITDNVDDMSDVAYLYLDLLEKLDLRGLRVIGHSLGGWAALEIAIRSIERIHSLALIASAGIHVKGSPKADIYMIDPDQQAKLAYADAALGEAAAERALASKYQEQAILNRIASARFGWNPRLYNPRLERWLHRVRVPTMIFWGDSDRIIPPVYGDALARLIPGAKLEKIANAGHFPHVEKIDDVANRLGAFLAR